MNRCFAALCALALAVGLFACGDDDDGPGFADAEPRDDADTTDAAPPDAMPDAMPPDAAPPDVAPLPDAEVSEFGPEITVLRILQGAKTIEPAENTGEYTSDRLVTGARFTVVCEALENDFTMIPVDSTSVQMTVIVGTTSQTAVAQPTPTPNEFVADFDIGTFPNGVLEIRCRASDIGDPVETNTGTATNFLDLGPRILSVNPVAGAHYANQVDVLIQVQPYPVSAADTGAGIPTFTPATCGTEVGDSGPCSVRACVGGKSIPLTIEDVGAGLYTTTIYFDANDYADDPLYVGKRPFDTCGGKNATAMLAWDPPIDGATSVEFYAVNARNTVGTTRLRRVDYVADSEGPAISISNPVPGQLVGGFMTVRASVSDPAGVSDVRATIAHIEEFPMIAVGGGEYVGTFDTRKLDQEFIFPLLEVRARDGVGNESGVGRVVVLDNQPPLLDFDPPMVREGESAESPVCPHTPTWAADTACMDALDDADCMATWNDIACYDPLAPSTVPSLACDALIDSPQGQTCRAKLVDAGCNKCFECSKLFDPVGPEAVDFGETVGQLARFRVRVEDTGNRPASVPPEIKLPLATTDSASVQMFVLDNAVPAGGGADTTPLLVDTDGDDVCDTINPTLVPTTVPDGPDEMAVVDLVPINGDGFAPRCVNCSPSYGTDPVIDDGRCVDYAVASEIDPVCGSTDLRRVIAAEDGNGPAIYSLPPLGCMGNPFDAFATNISEGWACVVAVAEDKLGNVGLSRPMPVCFYYGAGAPPAGLCSLATRPSCSDSCDYPATFADDPGFQLVERPPECSDGIDNDEDGDVDYPADAFCSSPDDPSED